MACLPAPKPASPFWAREALTGAPILIAVNDADEWEAVRKALREAGAHPACTAYQQSGVGNAIAQGANLPGAERHPIERRVSGGVRLAEGDSRRDRLHQMLLRRRGRPASGGPSLPVEPRAYARKAPFVLRCAITSPKVIFGAFGSAPSSFSSRTQLDARRVDSSACADVSKRLTEVMTPSPASIRK